MIAHLALALVAALQVSTAEPSSVVRGRVLSEQSGQPLAFAVVEMMTDHGGAVAVTDHTGNYVLRNVPPGLRLLRAQHIDHAGLELEILVPTRGEVLLDLTLALRPPILARLHVRGATVGGVEDTLSLSSTELSAATARALEATPGMAELGLAEVARGTPGHEPVDPSDVLYVRGAASDLKLVLLDGAPVYAPFHLGGLVNPFEPGVLAGARLFTGGAPARYDGGLSYVMELQTRRGRTDRPRTTGAADLLSGRGRVEGPIGGMGSFMVGARTVHDLATLRFLDHNLPYGFHDGLARLDFDLPDETHVGITGFVNREAVSLDTVPTGRRDASWGNEAGSIRWSVPFEKSDAEFTLALGNFRARMPVGGARPLLVEGIARRARLNADFRRTEGETELLYGVSFEQIGLRYKAWPRDETEDSLVLSRREDGSVGGGYVDLAMPAGRRLRLRGGLRADMYSLGEPLRISPRVEARLLLSDNALLTVSGGRYSQYVRAPEPAVVAPVEPGAGKALPPPLTLASASHLVVGLDHALGDLLRLGVETYYKRYEGLPTTQAHRTEASGLDLWVRRGSGGLTGWLGYSLGWLWSAEEPRPHLDFFAGRHLITLGLAGTLGSEGHFDVRFAYGAGLPYTAVPEPVEGTPEPAAGRPGMLPVFLDNGDVPTGPQAPDAPYVRLDASVSRVWRFVWMGERREVVPYIKVINALDRRDGLFYRATENGSEPRVLAALPVLPVIGMEWRF